MKKNLDTTKPCYSEQILPVRWPFVISRFFFICFAITGVRKTTEVPLYYDFRSLRSAESIARVTVVQFWSVPLCHVTLALRDLWTFEKVLRPILMTRKATCGKFTCQLLFGSDGDKRRRKYVYIRRLEREGPELE